MNDTTTISLDTPESVEEIWDRLFYASRHLIESALARNGWTHTFEDIDKDRKAGRVQFWPGSKSVIVTQIVDHPRKRIAHCFLAAGDLDELRRMRKFIEKWAKKEGCVAATLTGRKGWERHLKAEGYEYDSTLLEKQL